MKDQLSAALAKGATAVLTSWNRREVVRENLVSLLAQSVPFGAIIVVDNHSTDGTAEMLAKDFPGVTAIVMPDSNHGACETFNLGFARVATEFTAILDDDIVLPKDWLERLLAKFATEPETTAMLRPKWWSRGCRRSSSIPRGEPRAIHGHLSRLRHDRAHRGPRARRLLRRALLHLWQRARPRLANLGIGIPGEAVSGGRHLPQNPLRPAQGAPLDLLPHAQLLALRAEERPAPRFVGISVPVPAEPASQEKDGGFADATGTIGALDNIRATPWGWWIVFQATLAAFTVHLPYCLKRRAPVRAPDFELPVR